MREELERLLKSLSSFELSRIWTAFCEEYAPQEMIYTMTPSDLNEVLKYYDPYEIIEMTKNSSFNGNDKYWAFEHYSDGEELVSSNDYKSLVIIDMLINQILDTREDFDNDKIKDILKGTNRRV